ncbi:MAG TPA: Hsp70 family protein [Mycobacteriales bacterium]|nr:Hsp70 family protein [Mycobacteriales bacterium]
MTTYGIDLGTTYSCIAYVDDAGRAVIAKNALGEDTTPSVVYFESPDNVVVGRTAKDLAKLEPNLVVSLVKRQMGSTVEFVHHGTTHTPETVSALILKDLAAAAGQETGQPVHDVVITVPAYFGVTEREATRNAGVIAGLNVLNVVPEPVAAALHYESLSSGQDRTILVYDLGGGTFDTTVIRLAGEDVRVLCTDGDHHLGGADWDEKIVDYLLEQFTAEQPGSDPGGNEEFLQELANTAEQLKKDLSSVQARRHSLRFDGAVAKIELTRERFEELTSDLLRRTVEITERTVQTAAELGVTTFDDVLLVGGATRMPAVAASLRERFGFEPRLHDPDLAVAKGAALFALIESVKVSLPAADGADGAAALSDAAVEDVADRLGLTTAKVRALAEKVVTGVVPRAFGVTVIDSADPKREREIVAHVLLANHALPATTEPATFYTVDNDQTSVRIEVREQVGSRLSAELEHNDPIAEGFITGLPPLPAGSPLEVTFSMTETGVLTVYAVELSTRKDLNIEVRIRGLDERQVQTARAAVARLTLGE